MKRNKKVKVITIFNFWNPKKTIRQNAKFLGMNYMAAAKAKSRLGSNC